MLKTKGNIKFFRSPECNWNFNIKNGNTIIWGKTKDDDAQMAPMPLILDIEITTSCNGPGGKLCEFCYKNNTKNGKNMSFETFKTIIDKMPWLTQIAFGVDAQCKSNPDVWKIMEYTRSMNIVPNVTVADIDNDTADRLAKLCGAIAVSRYKNKDICYNSVKRLTDAGAIQVNIHQMISKETFQQAIETIYDIKNIDKLKKLRALVFLSLKQKGRAINNFNQLSQDEFDELMIRCILNEILIGTDSCSAQKVLSTVEKLERKFNYKFTNLLKCIEPCESTCFSSYINVDGEFYPCSFTEGENDWTKGIDVLSIDNFVDEVWNNERTINFRNKLINNNRKCVSFII